MDKWLWHILEKMACSARGHLFERYIISVDDSTTTIGHVVGHNVSFEAHLDNCTVCGYQRHKILWGKQ